MKTLCALIAIGILAAGCQTRSISHSEYTDRNEPLGFFPRNNGSDPGFEYRGELSEFDVLGIDRGELTSEAEIRRTLDNSKRVKLHPDSSILLIQSGALFPDSPM